VQRFPQPVNPPAMLDRAEEIPPLEAASRSYTDSPCYVSLTNGG
jgi:hypothetical protein